MMVGYAIGRADLMVILRQGWQLDAGGAAAVLKGGIKASAAGRTA